MSITGKPDPFSLQPLFSLLPTLGSLEDLEKYSTSFYARLEKIEDLLSSMKANDAEYAKFQAEQAMLQQVIDNLSLKSKIGG